MKKPLLLILYLFCSSSLLGANNFRDSLLMVLDKTISAHTHYTSHRELHITKLKQKLTNHSTFEQEYQINMDIIHCYETFICDSAERYINRNIEIAQKLGNRGYLSENNLQLAYIYSLSGLFIQADEIYRSIDYEQLPVHLKIFYCWNIIRYYENLIKYTDDPKFTAGYISAMDAKRDLVMSLLVVDSDEYRKEMAFKLQREGNFEAAIDILTSIFSKQEVGTHSFAMAAMSLAKLYRLVDDREQEESFLILAAITDTQLAVKENEALLVLAGNLFEKGDVNRSYNYICTALNDANFYNSRFKNTVIARVQPIIESSYLQRIESQQRNMRIYAILTSLFVIALATTMFLNFRQTKIVSKARKNLRAMNDKLIALNHKLNESNLIKEKYIGYFMNQCAIYINKLDEYRKDVNHKVKNGQFDRIYTPSSRALEKEVEELCANFDQAFLKLYPNFVEEFNSLLKPSEQYKVEHDHLNTELRIFALIRLGITDVGQSAIFLRYSTQTIYNYKSKVKAKSLEGGDLFEEKVKKLGSLSLKSD